MIKFKSLRCFGAGFIVVSYLFIGLRRGL